MLYAHQMHRSYQRAAGMVRYGDSDLTLDDLLLRLRRMGPTLGREYARQLAALLDRDPGLRKRLAGRDLAMLEAWRERRDYGEFVESEHPRDDEGQFVDSWASPTPPAPKARKAASKATTDFQKDFQAKLKARIKARKDGEAKVKQDAADAEQAKKDERFKPSKENFGDNPTINFGDLVKTEDGKIGLMIGAGEMGSGRVGVVDREGVRTWTDKASLTLLRRNDEPPKPDPSTADFFQPRGQQGSLFEPGRNAQTGGFVGDVQPVAKAKAVYEPNADKPKPAKITPTVVWEALQKRLSEGGSAAVTTMTHRFPLEAKHKDLIRLHKGTIQMQRGNQGWVNIKDQALNSLAHSLGMERTWRDDLPDIDDDDEGFIPPWDREPAPEPTPAPEPPKPKRRRPPDEQPRLFAADMFDSWRICYAEQTGKGRWITIGAKTDADGKKRGGSPVFVENGKITKGHPRLTGKKLGDGKLADEDRTDPDAKLRKGMTGREKTVAMGKASAGRNRSEHKQSRDYARAVWAKKARAEGIDVKSLHDTAAMILDNDREFVKDYNRALKEAREALDEFGGVHRTLGAQRAQARGPEEGAAIKGMDQVAEHMARVYPHLFHPETGAHGSHDDQLFELLSGGNRTAMTDDEAYEQALELILEHKGSGGDAPALDEDPVPFAVEMYQSWEVATFYADFDESKHPRADDGKFGSGPGKTKKGTPERKAKIEANKTTSQGGGLYSAGLEWSNKFRALAGKLNQYPAHAKTEAWTNEIRDKLAEAYKNAVNQRLHTIRGQVEKRFGLAAVDSQHWKEFMRATAPDRVPIEDEFKSIVNDMAAAALEHGKSLKDYHHATEMRGELHRTLNEYAGKLSSAAAQHADILDKAHKKLWAALLDSQPAKPQP